MKKVAVVYHSEYGHTQVLAQEVTQGSNSVQGIEAKLFNINEFFEMSELNSFDAIIMGCPTYMGGASAIFKKFIDSTSTVWLEQKWKNKLAAGFTNSGSMSGDKLSTLYQMVTFAAQQGMIWISQSTMPSQKAGDENEVNRIGSYLGMMAQSDNDSPDVTPPKGDRKTAWLLGQRVAELTLCFNLKEDC